MALTVIVLLSLQVLADLGLEIRSVASEKMVIITKQLLG